MRSLVAFLPVELLPLLISAGGLLFIIGARRLAGAAIVLAITIAVLPVVLAPMFDLMPAWLLVLVMIGLMIGLVLGLLGWLSRSLIGRRATDHMVGALAADVVRAVVVGCFRLAGRIMVALWRAVTSRAPRP